MENNLPFFLRIILTLVWASIAILLYRLAAPPGEEIEKFFEAVFFFYLGLTFLLARRWSSYALIFEWIYFVCTKIAFPRGKFVHIGLGLLFLLVFAIRFLQWMFIE